MLRVPLMVVLTLAAAGLLDAPTAAAAPRPVKKSVSGIAKAAKLSKVKKTGPVGKQTPRPALALVETVEPELELAQLAVAEQVLLGAITCEFGQTIDIAAVAGKPGHFVLHTATAHYAMLPYPTATGAVRLEDRSRGVVWLQIPSKSMLLSAALGQRLVDNCMHDAQRLVVVARADALGIAEPPRLLDEPGPDNQPTLEDTSIAAWQWTATARWPAMPLELALGWLSFWTPTFDPEAWTAQLDVPDVADMQPPLVPVSRMTSP